MSIRLIMEVLRNTPPGVSPAERLVLIAIAEKAKDDTRECWPGWDVLMRHTGLKRTGLKQALGRLAARGFEVRVEVAQDADGHPVYAYRGHRTRYRLPDLPELAPVSDDDSVDDEGAARDTPLPDPMGPPQRPHTDFGSSGKGPRQIPEGSRKGPRGIPKGAARDTPIPSRTLKELEQPSQPLYTPPQATTSDDDDVIDAEVLADTDLFGDPIDPPPPPSPVPAIVATYIDAVRSTDGVATSTMIGAIGKNAKRLIEVDKIHPAVVAIAAQRAGERRAKVLDQFLGSVQSSYDRGGDSRRAMFAHWQKLHDQFSNPEPDPDQTQIGQ